MAEESEEDCDDDSIDSFESDIEFEGEIVHPDDGPFQEAVYSDPSFKVDEKIHDATQLAKGKAIKAISEGKLDEALEHLTGAIVVNPKSAMLYSTRATVYIKMKKPNAAILDAHTALQINPNYAKGYKSRGLAFSMLGDWGQAVKDLHLASSLDHDEEIDTALKMAERNLHKIEEHRRKYDRLRKEREEEIIENARQCWQAEAQEQSFSSRPSSGMPGAGGFPGGVPWGVPGAIPGGMPEGSPGGMSGGIPQESAGGMPGGMPWGSSGGMPGGIPREFPGRMSGGMPEGFPGGMSRGFPGGTPGTSPRNIDLCKILNDPELMAAFSDPDIMAALQDVMNNPANFEKHKANPKMAPVIAKMMGKFTSRS